jgi:ABC-2 type transport system permease protein
MSILKGKYAALIRRELWEHRALWAAPLLVAAVMVIVPLFGTSRFARGDANTQGMPAMPQMFGSATMIGVAMTLGGVLCIALFAYLLDCLYAERKDRSILFWKSLPVSDAETVLTKVALALLLAPLYVLLVALVVHPLLLVVLDARFEILQNSVSFDSMVGGWKTLPHIAMAWLYGVLWYSPFVAYLLLASVLAKRVPLMYALLPPGVLMLLETLVIGSYNVAEFVGLRLAPWARDDWAWEFKREGGLLVGAGSPDWSVLFLSASLWTGLAVAAGMVYIVIRLRRYRDDT